MTLVPAIVSYHDALYFGLLEGTKVCLGAALTTQPYPLHPDRAKVRNLFDAKPPSDEVVLLASGDRVVETLKEVGMWEAVLQAMCRTYHRGAIPPRQRTRREREAFIDYLFGRSKYPWGNALDD